MFQYELAAALFVYFSQLFFSLDDLDIIHDFSIFVYTMASFHVFYCRLR